MQENSLNMINAYLLRKSGGGAVAWRIVEANRNDLFNQRNIYSSNEEDHLNFRQFTNTGQKIKAPLKGTVNIPKNLVDRAKTPKEETFQSNFRSYAQSLTRREQKWCEAKTKWVSGLQDCLLTSQINIGEVLPSEKMNSHRIRTFSQNMVKSEKTTLPRIRNNAATKEYPDCEFDDNLKARTDSWAEPKFEGNPREKKNTFGNEGKKRRKKRANVSKTEKKEMRTIDLDIVGEPSLIYQKTSASYSHSPKINARMIIKQGGLDG